MAEDYAPLRTSAAVHETDVAEVEEVTAAAPAASRSPWLAAAVAGAAGGAAVDIATRLIGG